MKNLHKILGLLFAGILLLNFYVPNSGEQKRVAVVTSVSGEVYSMKETSIEKTTLKVGSEVLNGDLVVVGKDSKVILFYMDGTVIVLEAGNQLLAGEDVSKSQKDDGSGMRGLLLNEASKLTSQNISFTTQNQRRDIMNTPGSYRGYGVVPVMPASFIYSTEDLVFAWVDSTGDVKKGIEEREYTLIIQNSNLEEIYRETVKGKTFVTNYFTLPSSVNIERSNKTNRYSWDIYVKGKEPNKGAAFELEGSFAVVDIKKAETFNSELNSLLKMKNEGIIDNQTLLILSAGYLRDQKMYYDAVKYLMELEKIVSSNIFIYEEQAFLFGKMGKNATIMIKLLQEKVEALTQN